ncbi:uncharacterized protein LOC126900971 isoform X3 [Daktulosphaira vitifoliae]|uniref:uncharacterized protein LOC126900971 isoform X3 n=1 Tax=Daktulosphaira vitifoliae TaxID=58002 RepID=UPI0021AB0283|nr:uncharacterized protein LOC126900971 isoform X3 [Daktulosphaira vitifoliae]
MSRTLNTITFFILFSVVLQIEAPTYSKQKVELLGNLLEMAQWKNINEVNCIVYNGRKYERNQIVGRAITTNNCSTYIRLATILLGCSYANILKTIFTFIDRFQNHCESLLNSENKNVNAINCTTELLDTISSSLIPLVKLMKGALESIDKIHTIPRSNHIKNDFILNKVITSLQHNTFLNFLTSTRVNSLNTSNILITLKHFFSKRHPELNVNKEICYPIKNLKFSSFGQHTNHQYNILKNKGFRGTEMEVYHFLRNRIKLIVQWAIKKRYDGLGFQCNLDTHETIFPSLSEQSKRKINKIPSEDLSESLLHDNIEEEMNKIPPKDLPESLLHDNIEEEEENLEDILLEIPNEFLPINMYL